MTRADSEYIVVGKIGKTYGIHGWLKVFSFTDVISGILEYDPWYLEDGENWYPIQRIEGREHGKGIVAKLKGYNNPEEARVLTGKKIAIKRAQLPKLPQNEYYWRDLIGLTVINQHGDNLGTVAYLMETGANDVIVVKGAGQDHAIPYLPDVITRIDLTTKQMHVNWELI